MASTVFLNEIDPNGNESGCLDGEISAYESDNLGNFSVRHKYTWVEATCSDELLATGNASHGENANLPHSDHGSLDVSSVPPAAMINVGSDSDQFRKFVTIDDAIDSLGTGSFQRMLLFAAGLCFMADSVEIMLLSFLSDVLEAEWGLTGGQTATVTSCVFAGSMIGTLFWGPLGDRIGRRPVFLACALTISVFGVATAACSGFPGLVATRFLVGFGVGGITVPFDILAELLPMASRGTYLMLIELFWTAGSMGVPLVAYTTFGNGVSWRVFVALCSIPCLASALIGFFLVPESPRWLLSKGRTTEAKRILRRAAARNGIDPDEVVPEDVDIKVEKVEESSRCVDLFEPKWRKVTFILWGVWIGYAFGYYGTILAVTRVFESDDNADDHSANDSEMVTFDYSAVFISSTAELAGTALVILSIDRVGRIPLQVLSYSIGGISLFLLCIFSANGSWGFLVSAAYFARVCEMVGSCTTWISTAEVLSTEIRTTGHSAANAVGRFGGILSPYLVDSASLLAVGFIMLLVHGFTAFASSRLPETKGKAMGKVDAVSSGLGSDEGSRETELTQSTRNSVGGKLPEHVMT